MVELWLCTDSAAEAGSVASALKRLQLRIYPDIVALSQAYMAYSQMYEQCKADQTHACSQYGQMYLAVQVWLNQILLCNITMTPCHDILSSAELDRYHMGTDPMAARPLCHRCSFVCAVCSNA